MNNILYKLGYWLLNKVDRNYGHECQGMCAIRCNQCPTPLEEFGPATRKPIIDTINEKSFSNN